MNKKAQFAIVLVVIILTVVTLGLLGMFEQTSGFFGSAIGGWVNVSGSPTSNIIVRLIVPAFIVISLISVFLVIRGALFG